MLGVVGVLACTGAEQQASHDFNRAWSQTPADSVTVDVSLDERVPEAESLVVLPLDSVLGFRLGGAPYRIRIVADGFVVLDVDEGRLLRFDSLGHAVADVPMVGVNDPPSAAICARGDSTLVVDGAGLYNQPRRLFWFALRADGVAPDSVTVTLPSGTLDARCMAVGDRWALLITIPEEPGNLASKLTTSLVEVTSGFGVREAAMFTLSDRSEQMRDSSGRAVMQPSPWASPPLIAAGGNGSLYVVDGPTGVVRILDTTAAGARIRGITPRPRSLTRALIDSFAAASREQEMTSAALRGPLSPDDIAMLDQAEHAIRRVTPGTPVPEVTRLLVGADGSFALAASEWLVPDADRWDLFDQAGGYLGAVRISASSRGVGVQHGTLWYVGTTNDSVDGSPQLVRVRPRQAAPPPE